MFFFFKYNVNSFSLFWLIALNNMIPINLCCCCFEEETSHEHEQVEVGLKQLTIAAEFIQTQSKK